MSAVVVEGEAVASGSPTLNRQARLALGTNWFDFGPCTISEAAIKLVKQCWFLNAKHPARVEVRCSDHPETVWTVEVIQRVDYTVRGLRGGD